MVSTFPPGLIVESLFSLGGLSLVPKTPFPIGYLGLVIIFTLHTGLL